MLIIYYINFILFISLVYFRMIHQFMLHDIFLYVISFNSSTYFYATFCWFGGTDVALENDKSKMNQVFPRHKRVVLAFSSSTNLFGIIDYYQYSNG